MNANSAVWLFGMMIFLAAVGTPKLTLNRIWRFEDFRVNLPVQQNHYVAFLSKLFCKTSTLFFYLPPSPSTNILEQKRTHNCAKHNSIPFRRRRMSENKFMTDCFLKGRKI